MVRPIRPDDAETLRAAYARLSPSSRYRRFFGGVSELSEETLRYLTNVDGTNHFAVVAGIESPDLKTERGLGAARFIRLADDPEIAEPAVTVIDDMQGKGIGRILLKVLSEAARERGVRKFRAQVLASNAPVRALLDEVGAVVHREESGAIVFDVALGPPDPEPQASHALSRLLREAAASMAVMIRHLRPPTT